MAPVTFKRILFGAGVIFAVGFGLLGLAGWRLWQTTPGYRFREARRLWNDRPFAHYRLAANYSTNWAQCYYDIEVRDDRILKVFGLTCLSSESAQTLTVGGIFKNFERYTTQRVCSPNGCYCEGTYVVRATYDSTLGYPHTITTVFERNWVDDLLHGKYKVQTCLRTTPVVEKIEVVTLVPLP